VNLLEGAGTGALLLDAGATGGLAHHAALADEDDVAVRELLLELAGEATLDLVERLDLGNGDEDDDGLLAALDVDLAGRRDLERTELGLEVGDVVLEVEESLSDQRLGGIRSGAGRVGGPEDLGGDRLSVGRSVRGQYRCSEREGRTVLVRSSCSQAGRTPAPLHIAPAPRCCFPALPPRIPPD
jgi:hypothetical protein